MQRCLLLLTLMLTSMKGGKTQAFPASLAVIPLDERGCLMRGLLAQLRQEILYSGCIAFNKTA
jgi:hypothetical protein